MSNSDKNLSLLITHILGKTPNLDSSVRLKEGKMFLLSPHVLKCLKLKVTHIPQCPEPLQTSHSYLKTVLIIGLKNVLLPQHLTTTLLEAYLSSSFTPIHHVRLSGKK